MERRQVERWFEAHPHLIHGDAHELVSHCEPTGGNGLGAHASEAYVARDVCAQLAHELQHHEPDVRSGDEEHLAGGPLKAALEPEGWNYLAGWILEVAREEEHATWVEIVRYTQRRARALIREHHLSADTRFDHTRCYGKIAPRIMELLARDFSQHAFPR